MLVVAPSAVAANANASASNNPGLSKKQKQQVNTMIKQNAGKGPQGPTGPQGSPGPNGNPGAAGAKGATGAAGAKGPTGAKGATGAKGPTGAKGATGAKGPTGAAGAPGTPGAAGATGAKGPTGAAGTAGPTGAKGPTGEKGPPGGATGATGLQGPVGLKGATGATGPKGDKGATGPSGGGGGGLPTVLGSGESETGFWSYNGNGSPLYAAISFTVPLPAAIEMSSGNVIYVKAGDPTPADCENSSHPGAANMANPEASSGFVCIYEGPSSGSAPFLGILGYQGATSEEIEGVGVSGAHLLFGATEFSNGVGTFAATG